MIQLKIGNISYHFRRFPQEKQCDGSVIIDCFSGVRYITTLRKLPMTEPNTNTKTQVTM